MDRHRKSPGNSVGDKPVVPRLNFVKAGISPKDPPSQQKQIYEVSMRFEDYTTIRTNNHRDLQEFMSPTKLGVKNKNSVRGNKMAEPSMGTKK